jgi:hypothetical protein
MSMLLTTLVALTIQAEKQDPSFQKPPIHQYLAYTQVKPPKNSLVWDCGIVFPNQLISGDGDNLWISDPFVPNSPSTRITHPVPEAYRSRNMAKYRNGKFFARSGADIFEWDSNLKRWFTVLATKKPFTQFEVAPDGSILLIGTMNPENESAKSYSQAEISLETLKDGKLIEQYEPLGTNPKNTVDYPDDFLEIAKSVGQVRGFDRTMTYNEYILIISTDLGQVKVFNTLNGTLRNLDVPWASITPEKLKSLPRSPMLPKTATTLLDGDGMPGYNLYIFPASPYRAHLLYRDNSLSSELADRMRTAANKRGMNFGLLSKTDDDPVLLWHVAELDLVDNKITNLRRIQEKEIADIPWIKIDGEISSWSKEKERLEKSLLPKKLTEPISPNSKKTTNPPSQGINSKI